MARRQASAAHQLVGQLLQSFLHQHAVKIDLRRMASQLQMPSSLKCTLNAMSKLTGTNERFVHELVQHKLSGLLAASSISSGLKALAFKHCFISLLHGVIHEVLRLLPNVAARTVQLAQRQVDDL